MMMMISMMMLIYFIVMDYGNMSRSVVATAMFWLALAKVGHCLPSWLMAAVTPLA
jgi:hypothetical protein